MNAETVLACGTRLWIGARVERQMPALPRRGKQIFFANHTSHLDTLALLAALPRDLREVTSPVAARDYWGANPVLRGVAGGLLRAVFVDRRVRPGQDPLREVRQALQAGRSLILFPEGTRRAERVPGPFKSGLYRLARLFPEVDLVPAYLGNLYRAMPKGSLLPVPLTATVHFGEPMRLRSGETKPAFLQRAREAVIALS